MTNNFDKAIKFHSHSLEMSKKLYPNQNHLFIARALHNLGATWKFKDPIESLNFYNLSFEMYKRLYQNEDHPNVSISLNNLGFIWRNKDFTKSLNFYNQSFEMAKRLFDNQDHPDIILPMINLSIHLCRNPLTKKKGLSLIKQYKKIVTKNEDKQEIENLLKKYETNIGRDKSKRKKR